MDILVIDVGGSHVKVLASGQTLERKVVSGPTLTAAGMVEAVKRMTSDWTFDAVSLGYPGPVVHGVPIKEPVNLGPGWVGFDFATAFGRPTTIINDAAMQALGSYEGGRMLFLGLGTGLGSAMVVEGVVQPMELAHLPYTKRHTYEGMVGLAALKRLGREKWRRKVNQILGELSAALEPDYIVLGGGNAKLLAALPPNVRMGNNDNAFKGGFRLWETAPAPSPREGVSDGRGTQQPMTYLRSVDQSAMAAAPADQRFSRCLLDHDSGSQHCSIHYIRTPAGSGSPAGMHTHVVDQIFYILSGTMSLEIEGTQYEAPPGTLVVFPAGVPHRNWNAGTEPTVHLAFNTPLPDPKVPFAVPVA